MVSIEWKGKKSKEEVVLESEEVYDIIYQGSPSILIVIDEWACVIKRDGYIGYSEKEYFKNKDVKIIRKITDKIKIVVEK